MLCLETPIVISPISALFWLLTVLFGSLLYFDNGLALGVSEGAYFDLDNLIKGFGYNIKPYELSVSTFSSYINPSYFQFDVRYFVEVLDKNIPKSNLLLGFLNLLVHYYLKDCNNIDTKTTLESIFGEFTRKRFLND